MNRKTNRVWKVPTTWSNIKALFETTRYSWNYSIIYKYQNWLKVLCINYHIITITIGAESIVGYNCCRLLLLRQFNEWLKNWCMWIVREYGSQWPRVLKIWCQPFVAIKKNKLLSVWYSDKSTKTAVSMCAVGFHQKFTPISPAALFLMQYFTHIFKLYN